MPDPQPSPDAPTRPAASEETIQATAAGSEETLPRQQSPVRPAAAPRRLGPYELSAELGRGGMGVVYRARHTQLGTERAVKVLLGGPHASNDMLARFRREASAVARMGKHPHLVAVHDLGEEDGLTYYAMELVEGRSLRALLAAGPMAPRDAASLVEKVARALHVAHSHGIVHRDVKPENILVRAGPGGAPEPLLADFGLARDVRAMDRLSATGDVMGTPAYMAPEQVRAAATDARTDVYALGAVLYELLTGRLAHPGRTVQEVFSSILEAEVPSPRSIQPDLSRDLQTIALACLEPDPARRYASAEALADDLARYLRGEAVLARPLSTAERLWRRARRHWVAVLVVAGIVACAAALGWQASRVRSAESKGSEAIRLSAKTQLVSRVLLRWSALSPTIARLEANAFDSWISPEERRANANALWLDARASLNASPTDATSQATALALEGWALQLAGDRTGGLDLMRSAAASDPDVPFGPLMEALVELEPCLDDAQSRLVLRTSHGVELGPVPATPPEIEERWRRIDALVARVLSARVWGRESGEGIRAAATGLRALRLGDYASAERDLSRALSDPDLLAFEGALRSARLATRYYAKAYDGAMEDVARLSVLRPRNALVALMGGRVRLADGVDRETADQDPLPAYDDAIARLTAVLKDHPDWTAGLSERSYALTRRAIRGGTLDADLRAAAEDIERAVAEAPEDERLLEMRGGVRMLVAQQATNARKDPRKGLRSALDDFEEVLRRDPAHIHLHSNVAGAYLELADAEREWGGDAAASDRLAIAAYDRVIQEDPTAADAFASRGLARCAIVEARDPGSPGLRALADLAVADLAEAFRLRPGDDAFRVDHAHALVLRGSIDLMEGRDARTDLRDAIAELDGVLRRDPAGVLALVARGQALFELGSAMEGKEAGSEDAFSKAAEDFDAAIRLSPGDVQALHDRGITRISQGGAADSAGKDPREFYRKAVEDFTQVLSLRPSTAARQDDLGDAQMGLSVAEQEHGGDPRPAKAAAIDAYREEVRLDPKRAEAWKKLALVLDAAGRLDEAAEAVENALRLAPDDASAKELRGVIRAHREGK